MEGKTFGRLTARTPTRLKGRPAWECRCVCGKVVTVRADRLAGGRTRSCGCLRSAKRGPQTRARRGNVTFRGAPTKSSQIVIGERYGNVLVCQMWGPKVAPSHQKWLCICLKRLPDGARCRTFCVKTAESLTARGKSYKKWDPDAAAYVDNKPRNTTTCGCGRMGYLREQRYKLERKLERLQAAVTAVDEALVTCEAKLLANEAAEPTLLAGRNMEDDSFDRDYWLAAAMTPPKRFKFEKPEENDDEES